MIGITFALPSESSDLVRQLQARQRDGDLVLGKIDNCKVAIAHTGVGAKHCNQRLELLIHRARPKLIISSGFAGAVTEELSVGDVIIAENFSDPGLIGHAAKILSPLKSRRARLFTSTSIVDSVFARNEIARGVGAAAVDMETGAIVEVCKAHGLPLLSLRAISDTPSKPFPAPPTVLFDVERQGIAYGRLFSYILRDPAAIRRLFAFSRQVARARSNLTDALVTLARKL